jgi:hypothetical protein
MTSSIEVSHFAHMKRIERLEEAIQNNLEQYSNLRRSLNNDSKTIQSHNLSSLGVFCTYADKLNRKITNATKLYEITELLWSTDDIETSILKNQHTIARFAIPMLIQLRKTADSKSRLLALQSLQSNSPIK